MFSPEANLFLGEVVKKLGSCVLAQVRGGGRPNLRALAEG